MVFLLEHNHIHQAVMFTSTHYLPVNIQIKILECINYKATPAQTNLPAGYRNSINVQALHYMRSTK